MTLFNRHQIKTTTLTTYNTFELSEGRDDFPCSHLTKPGAKDGGQLDNKSHYACCAVQQIVELKVKKLKKS